jgi:hypothetical protein
MKSTLTVRLAADTNYIPVRYRIIEMNIANPPAATYCLLEVVRVGWDTVGHYNDWKSNKYYDTASGVTHLTGRSTVGMQGTLGAFSIAVLTDLRNYTTYDPLKDYIGLGKAVMSGSAITSYTVV